MRKSFFVCVMVNLTLVTVALGQMRNWDYRYRGWGGQNIARLPLVGPGGDIYVAGTVEDSTMHGVTNFDIAVARIRPDGGQSFLATWDDPQHYADQAQTMAIGADGNIYAGGIANSNASPNPGDLAILSLFPDGQQRWIYTQAGTSTSDDEVAALVCAPDSNVYAAGFIGTFGGHGDDIIVLSLTMNDSLRWTYYYNDSTNGADHGLCMTRGLDGNLYAAGYAYNDSMGADQLIVISLTPNGDQRWVYKYRPDGFSIAVKIICGADSNLYVAGACTDTAHDFLVLSLTPQGVERWSWRYNGSANSDDYAYGLVWGSDGNLYALGGGFAGSPAVGQTSLFSLTPAGAERWRRFYGPSRAWHGEFQLPWTTPLALGTDGNVYAISSVPDSGFIGHARVMSLTMAGDPRWTWEYNGSGWPPYYQGAVPLGVLWGPDSNLYIAGYCYGADTAEYFELLSLDPALGVAEQPAIRAAGHCSARITGSLLDCDLNLASSGPVEFALIDRQGREVESWRVEARAGRSHFEQSLNRLSSGVYFLSVRAPGANRSDRAKLVLVR